MNIAVERTPAAITNRERIRIVTDYDVDGTTSSLILQSAIRLMGHPAQQIDYHIPDRFDEGYGFSVRAAETAISDGVQLILTDDIGVRDHVAVETAKKGQVDVIICDHHLPPGESVPKHAVSVLCPPQTSCSYPNPDLAACGVSQLAQALLENHPASVSNAARPKVTLESGSQEQLPMLFRLHQAKTELLFRRN